MSTILNEIYEKLDSLKDKQVIHQWLEVNRQSLLGSEKNDLKDAYIAGYQKANSVGDDFGFAKWFNKEFNNE